MLFYPCLLFTCMKTPQLKYLFPNTLPLTPWFPPYWTKRFSCLQSLCISLYLSTQHTTMSLIMYRSPFRWGGNRRYHFYLCPYFCQTLIVQWLECLYLPPNHTLNPNADVMVLEVEPLGVIRSWGWSPQEWEQCPYKRRLRTLPHHFCHVRTEQEDGRLWTGKWALTRHRICWHTDLGLPSLQNCVK